MRGFEVLLGLLFVVGGIGFMSQARLPKEKRIVRLGRSGDGPIPNAGQCIRVGGIFAILGASVALEGTGVHFETPHVLVALALAAIAIRVRTIFGDDA